MNTPAADQPILLSARVQQMQSMYTRLTLFQLYSSDLPHADVRLPHRYLATMIAEVQKVFPHIKTYIVESYKGHSRVLLWDTSVEGGTGGSKRSSPDGK